MATGYQLAVRAAYRFAHITGDGPHACVCLGRIEMAHNWTPPGTLYLADGTDKSDYFWSNDDGRSDGGSAGLGCPAKIARRTRRPPSKKSVRAAVRAGGKVVQQEMVQQAAKDTGLLSEHIDVRTRGQRGEARAIAALIGPNGKKVIHPQPKGKTAGLPRTASFIARLLEFGSSRQPKHPFLTASFEASKGRALDAIIQKLRGVLGWSLS